MENSENQMSTVAPRTSEEIAGALELLFGPSNEQHAFIDAMKYIRSQGYSSSTAVFGGYYGAIAALGSFTSFMPHRYPTLQNPT